MILKDGEKKALYWDTETPRNDMVVSSLGFLLHHIPWIYR